MISSFSEAGYLIPRRPHPRTCFFEQAQVQGLLGDDLVQRPGFPAQVLDLAAGRRPRGVACAAPLASLQELLRPGVIRLSAKPSRRHNSAMLCSPRRPSSTMRIFSSAEYCLHVTLRMSFTIRSEDNLVIPDFWLISTPQWL